MQKLNKEEIHQWCLDRGYELHSRISGDEVRYYSKHFDKFFLSLTVHFTQGYMKIQAFPGLFTLSTGEIQVMHPRFDDLFERRMEQMMHAIEYDNARIA
jgi:hypothetical protein